MIQSELQAGRWGRPRWRNGRRGGLKIRFPQGSGGSNPFLGTSLPPHIHHLDKREDLVGASGKAGYDGRYQSKAITNEVHSLCRRERCLSSTLRRTLRLV